jgi:hypothetical protein
MKPRPGVKTNVKGWMDNKDNLQYDERLEITKGVKKNSQLANVILDLTNKTIVRNRFNDTSDFKEFFKYYFGGYHKYVSTVMKEIDPEYLETFLAEMEAEVKAAEAKEAEVPAE